MKLRAPLAALLLLAAGLARAGGQAAPGMTVCVFYDAGKDGKFKNGRLHAIMLENLLGHFREARVSLKAVQEAPSGELDGCDRAAYVGSYYDEPLPESFVRETAAFRRPFLWINYNIRQLQKAMGEDAFAARTGFVFRRTQGFDPGAPAGTIPGFYRFFDYKGRRFTKLAFVRPSDGAVVAAPELSLVEDRGAAVLATAVHSVTGSTTPYVTRKGPFFYVADNPFLYIHEQDRYLILADLLFDFLGLPPRGGPRRALVRLEDIHPNYDLRLLKRSVDLLKARGVPFAISLIPDFVAAGRPEADGVTLAQRPEFVEALRYAQANGGVILLHGYTHNAAGLAGCPSLASGFDYEFWDRCRQAPLANDSAELVRARVAAAEGLLASSSFTAVAWVTPHYAASPDDFREFALLFLRTVQRVRYALDEPQAPGSPDFVSQFFPYTIYRDHYGQFVWPEDLGFVPMPGLPSGDVPASDIAAAANVESVIRDSWASFFWHPQLMAKPGEEQRLGRIIDSIRKSGFTFVSLKDLKAAGE
jgi:uncharacterized protein YdaL